VPPQLAAGKMTLPEGFRATLFAGEPNVVQPIAFWLRRPRPAVGRGMLFVSRLASRPQEGQGPHPDLRDTDGDGKFDKRTVFAATSRTSPASSTASACLGLRHAQPDLHP